MDPDTRIGPFNMATPYSLTFLSSVLVVSVDKFCSTEDQVTDMGFCVRCLKLLFYNPDYVYSYVNLQWKCKYCVRLGKEYKMIPHHYHHQAQDVATSKTRAS